jgi:gluconate 2-dehydrogenase gamma chain
MSDITRRDAVRRLGLALMATGVLDRVAAQEVHHLAAGQATRAGAYTPLSFNPHEFATLERLTDLIIPVENGRPGASAAGAAAWIDTIASENDKLKGIYRSGFTWIDAAMTRRSGSNFVSATPAKQIELLDSIAFRRNQTDHPDLAPGIEFFSWVRRMTVDAFYTSEIGIKDIDYRGNSPMASYPAPAEAIEYALKRSGL